MRLKLFWKLGLGYLLLLLAALAAVYIYTTRALERNILESTFARLDSLVRISAKRPPPLDDVSALRAWTAWMAESGARVTVIDNTGGVLADSGDDPAVMDNHRDRPEIRQAFELGRGRATRFSATVRRDLVYLAVRFDWGPSPPVVVRFATTQVSVTEAIGDVRGPMASVSLLALVIGGGLALVFSRLFSERVRRLHELSKRIADGDFAPTPDVAGEDEISELAMALNDTAARMARTIESLEGERNQSRALLSSMSEGVVVVDAERRVRFSNRAFREVLRLTMDGDALRGRHLVEVTNQQEILAMTETVLEQESRMESEITTPGPDSRDMLVRAAPVGDGAVLVLLDISDIRRLERVRRDFVANVSHELKTPLTAIRGFAETLLSGALEEPENGRRFAEIIREHATRLGRLTEDLLKLSRIEAGKMELEPQPVELRDVIDRCVETSRIKADRRKQTIEVELPAPVPIALADPPALLEVLQNLVDNAIQYSPEGRAILIRGAMNAHDVSLAVVDDGLGIPADSHDRIFERFYRVDAARSRSVGGTGLGLAITRHLVDSMHGRIEVASKPGQGSTFTVYLPKSDNASS